MSREVDLAQCAFFVYVLARVLFSASGNREGAGVDRGGELLLRLVRTTPFFIVGYEVFTERGEGRNVIVVSLTK